MKLRLIISCALGTERALGNELRHLGLGISDSGKGKFEIETDLAGALTALRCLRCAERVFLELATFGAYQFEELFQGVRAIDWAAWLPASAKIHIDKVRLFESSLNSVASVQSVAQKAAYEKLGSQYNLRSMPESGQTHLVRLYVERNRVRVCLDLAGEALHRRGYRTKAGEAPLKESIAASLILFSTWRRRVPFHDPFCGSGTLAIEALLYAANIPPNLQRTMAIQDMGPYDAALDASLCRQWSEKIATEQEFIIRASDRDPRMMELTKENFTRALDLYGLNPEQKNSLAKRVVVEQCRMENIKKRENSGYFFCNPPWGDRLGDQEQALATYAAMRHLGDAFPDWALSAISAYDDLAGPLQRNCEWRKPVRNGSAESWFYLFGPIAPAISD